MVAAELGAGGNGPGDKWLRKVAGWTWRVKLSLSMMLELMGDLRGRAQEDAIQVFARNLKDLLFAAPAGARPTLGLDPGIRTGVKAAVVDATGNWWRLTRYTRSSRRTICAGRRFLSSS